MSLNNTPRGSRLHIGIFGRRNSGKSSLINALTGQDTALVSAEAGTTTDPVYKGMELYPIGPIVFIDTAGFDDEGSLGEQRVERTKGIIKKTDIAILLFEEGEMDYEKNWLEALEKANIPVIPVVNKSDKKHREALIEKVKIVFGKVPYMTSTITGDGLQYLRNAIINIAKENVEPDLIGGLAKEGDTVLLVMPQDIQAPKGRLILPQVQTIRRLLDEKCTVISVTNDKLEEGLFALKNPPSLIITDSQCFKQVFDLKPSGSKLTSFSILFAAYKGEIEEFVAGANAISKLNKNSKVLIAEACTHAPLEEDIGRVKIPAKLKKLYPQIEIDIVSGSDFPETLEKYNLIIHCGACMFNRKHVLSRIESAKKAHVAITNYGVAMAYFAGILDKVEKPI